MLETDDEFSDLPKEGWRRVNLTRTKAVFVVDSWSGHRFPYQEMVLERTNGRWRWGGGGDCRPLAAGDEGSGAIWHLQGGPESVDEGDARLDLMLQEMECSGTRKPPRKAIHPEVIYGETYIVVIVRIEPVKGFATCPGTPPTQYTLQLDEQVGDRRLLDGGHYPPTPRS